MSLKSYHAIHDELEPKERLQFDFWLALGLLFIIIEWPIKKVLSFIKTKINYFEIEAMLRDTNE